jgi:hypothetical protein
VILRRTCRIVIKHHEPSQHIVGQHLVRQVMKETPRFLFVDIEVSIADLAGFQVV